MDTSDRDTRSAAEVLPLLLFPMLLVASSVGESLYACSDRNPVFFRVLCQVCFLTLMWAWFRGYSRRHHIAWPMDMGLHLAMAWWMLVPYYILKVQGWRGLGVIAAFMAMYTVALGAGAAVSSVCAGE